MFKFLAGIIGLFIAVNCFAVVTSPISNSFDAIGTIINKDKITISVLNGQGTTIAKGALVALSATADDGATVKVAPASNISDVLCVMENTCTDGSMCSCLVYGYTDALLFSSADGSAVAGESIYSSDASAGYSRALIAASVGAYMVKVGTFLDASAASGAIEAFIHLL
jgi:hypothetical protein